MSSPRRALLACNLVLAIAIAHGAAHADDAAARQYFRRGVDLYDKKQYQPALEQFRAAYGEKPSPGIKQNIALCLKGLGRPVEAATAFDEALDEGANTLKPEVRAAIEKELAELSRIVATVRLRFIAVADKKPLSEASITVDGVALPPSASRRPVRLDPGIHVFKAHVDGLADPPEKRLSILAGDPVDATFQIGTAAGTLTVRANVPDAVVKVDGTEVGRGGWSGTLSAGTHRVAVSADTYQTASTDVVVSSGASVEYPIALRRAGEGPPEYVLPAPRKPLSELKKRYVVPMLAYDAQGLRLAPVLGELPGGTKHSFTGGTVGARAGYRMSRSFSIEIYGDVGQLSDSYTLSGATSTSHTKVLHWQLTPAVRFVTIGSVRFTVATGVGIHGLSVDADVFRKTPGPSSSAASGTSTTNEEQHKGSGASASWLTDLGLQIDIGTLFLEAVAFFDMHGVGSPTDEATGARLLYSSPGTRVGIRAGLGFQF